jgi:hypothetical protein
MSTLDFLAPLKISKGGSLLTETLGILPHRVTLHNLGILPHRVTLHNSFCGVESPEKPRTSSATSTPPHLLATGLLKRKASVFPIVPKTLQGYLAHKNPPPPRTLQ